MRELEQFRDRLLALKDRAHRQARDAALTGSSMARLLATKATPSQITEELAARYHEFQSFTSRISRDVIYPRFRVLREIVPSMKLVSPDREQGPNVGGEIPLSPRVPARVKIRIELGHDGAIESLIARYRLEIRPALVQYNAGDRLNATLQSIDPKHLTNWVEERMSDAIEAYLRIEPADQVQREHLATDPVALVRLSKQSASGTLDYRGHRFYFVTPNTESLFVQDPARYVTLDE